MNKAPLSDTDSLGLPRRMWWLWPFLVLLVVIWIISLWAIRVPQTSVIYGVVTAQQGLGRTARAELSVFIPERLKPRPLGEKVRVTCNGQSWNASVDREASEVLSVQDIRDLIGSRLIAERLFRQTVRVQSVVTESGTDIPAPGEQCDVTVIDGRARLITLLGTPSES